MRIHCLRVIVVQVYILFPGYLVSFTFFYHPVQILYDLQHSPINIHLDPYKPLGIRSWHFSSTPLPTYIYLPISYPALKYSFKFYLILKSPMTILEMVSPSYGLN